MILNTKNIKKIRNKEITFIKNFTAFSEEIDFNYISRILEENELPNTILGSIARLDKTIWQIKNVHLIEDFFTYFNFFKKTFNYANNERDGTDLFLSFSSSLGTVHFDEEDVHLIGLLGKTLYRIYPEKKEYILYKGDYLFIPHFTKHRAISLTPRVIMSSGYYTV